MNKKTLSKKTLFQIIPLKPNPREQFHKKVEDLCKLLNDDEGKNYRVSVFQILGVVSGKTFEKRKTRYNLNSIREYNEAKHFLKTFVADVRALEIMTELEKIYDGDVDQIDHLRGAVGEVFAYHMCRKVYQQNGIEAKVGINGWASNPIDAVGCNDKNGFCLQCKASLTGWGRAQTKLWISMQKQEREMENIREKTSHRARCAFLTYLNRASFDLLVSEVGGNSEDYNIFDRSDLCVLEHRLAD